MTYRTRHHLRSVCNLNPLPDRSLLPARSGADQKEFSQLGGARGWGPKRGLPGVRRVHSQNFCDFPMKAVFIYFVNGSITRSNPIAFGNLFAPSGESIGESTVPRRTFFECNGTPAIVVNDRNIKPRPVF